MSEEITKLIEKFLSRTISDEEVKKLLDAYQGKKITEKQLEDYYALKWSDAAQCPSSKAEESRQKIWKQMQAYLLPRSYSIQRVKQRWKSIAGIAAVGMLLFAIGYSLRLSPAHSSKELVVTIENGQKANVQLPDGSRVRLNSASELRYPSDFGKKKRIVKLKGEAYFEVESNPKRPFIVQTRSSLEIKALGTKFNIKSYPDDAHIISTLIEGKIEVCNPELSEMLNPGEQMQYHTEKGIFNKLTVENVEEAIFWMTDQFVFSGETLENIARILERTYNVTVSFASPEIKEIHYSGKIKNNSIENVLNLIAVVSPIQYTMTDSHITLSKK
jgi:ferric-dicitrate binding protein FerR (iron transport regulator)